MKYWIEDFQKTYPNVKIDMEAKASGTAGPALTNGTADLGPVAREMLPGEEQEFEKKFGYKPYPIRVAGGSYRTPGKTHAIAFFVNEKNPIEKLSYDQVDAIFSSTRKRGYKEVTKWRDVGATGEWADKPVHLWGLIRPNGIAHFLEQRVLEGGEWKSGIEERTTVGSLAALDATNQGVAKDPYAIGYAGFGNVMPGVKPVALAEKSGGPYYKGTFEEVLEQKYPLSRVIYIYVNQAPGKATRSQGSGVSEVCPERERPGGCGERRNLPSSSTLDGQRRVGEAEMNLRQVVYAALICFASFLSSAADKDDPKQTGPLTLIIQYKCLPGQRTEFRQRMAVIGLHNFEKWKADGILSAYQLLFSRYVDTNGWDMLALLTFEKYADLSRWRAVEASMPAGLPVDAVSLSSSVETYPADLMRQGTSRQSGVRPVYLVVPYTISVAAPAYLKYFDVYVRPQFEGWIQEGVLSRYQVFMQRYTAGRPWDTLILLTYKDDESLGQRETVVAKVREKLQK